MPVKAKPKAGTRAPAPAPTPAPTPATIEQPDDEATQTPGDPLADGDRDALQTLLDELAGVTSARVTVYRTNRNGPQAYLFHCPAESFSLDDLRDRYNGGEFRVYISREGKPWKNLRVNVAPPERHEPQPVQMADLVIAMREGFEAQAKLLRDVLTARTTTPALGDLPQLIRALAEVTRPTPPPPPPPPPALPFDPADLLLQGIELANKVQRTAADTGGRGGSASFLDVVRELIRSPAVAAWARAFMTQTTMQPQRTPTAPPPASPGPIAQPTPQPNVAAPAAQPADVDDMQAVIAHYLDRLVRKAAERSDPALYADLIVDNAPEETLRAFLLQPDPVAELARLNPEVARHRAWFDALVEAVRDALDSPDAE